MAIYEYQCPEGHTHELVRKYAERTDPATCPECGGSTEVLFSAHHRQPDGIYSYAPNEGSEEKFVRWNDKIKADKLAEAERTGRDPK